MGRVRVIVVIGLVLGLLMSAAAVTADPQPVERIFGPDRVATAVEVSAAHWTTADVALIATARDFPDALAAGALAAKLEAPLLLTEPASLPGVVSGELQRLGVDQVIVLGGPAAVADAVLDDIAALDMDVRRVAGSNRYETAAAVAHELGSADTVVIASGENFPDALSAGTFAAQLGWPVLLTTRDLLPTVTTEAILDLGASSSIVVGGGAVVSDVVVDGLRGVAPATRVAGPNRYATAAAVIAAALEQAGAGERTLVVATGEAFPDALAAGALAARVDGLVLLTPPQQLADDAVIRELAAGLVGAIVVGGPAVVDDFVLEEISAALTGDPPPQPPQPDPPPPDPDPTCVDLNTASFDELRLIIHIDEVRAQAIIDGRPWGSVEELIQISGIGAVRLQDIKDQGLASVDC